MFRSRYHHVTTPGSFDSELHFSHNANVIFGALVDDDIVDEVSITVLATGFNSGRNMNESANKADVPDFLTGGR